MSEPITTNTRGPAALIIGCLLSGFLLGAAVDRGWQNTQSVSADRPSSRAAGVVGLGQLPSADMNLQDVDFKRFWEVWNLLKEKYYQQPLKDKDLFYGAISGLAQSTGDPYTSFFEPKLADEFQQSLSGKFEGIGAEIGLKDGQLQIIAPLPDTPSDKAGLLAGDWIVKIDGTDTTDMAVDKAVSLIRGAKGTKVKLTIFRPSTKKAPYDVEITRDVILVKSVKYKALKDGISYIEITHFNNDTQALFADAIARAQKDHAKGIILDLRNDPGGYLDTSLSVAGAWVKNDIVVKERRQGQITDELRGKGNGEFANIPTIVLVNQGSASASEIVAGALQDYGKARLLGTKTFGKGSVQDYQTLSDGSGIKITIAEWLTPQERTINKTGLEPDIKLERTDEDYAAQRDPQLDLAVGLLNGSVTTTTHIAPAATSTRP